MVQILPPEGPEAARQALRTWLDTNDKSLTWLAAQLEVTQPTASRWLTSSRPEEALRAAIEQLTTGAVPALSWRTEEERELLKRLEAAGGAS